MPNRDIWMTTLFAGFSHHGGRSGLLPDIPATLPVTLDSASARPNVWLRDR
jgi:hypothetical protein